MGLQAEVETWAWRAEVQPGTLRNTELVEGKPEARLMSRTELAAGAEPRSWTTPVEPMNPGDWLKPVQEMGPGNLTETSEEEDLWTGPAKKSKV